MAQLIYCAVFTGIDLVVRHIHPDLHCNTTEGSRRKVVQGNNFQFRVSSELYSLYGIVSWYSPVWIILVGEQ